MTKPRVVHDPVHGTIILSELEQLLIDTPQFQRLRGIQQLGLADVVFPGANHTRFEHSVGTMHTASLLGNYLELGDESVLKLRLAGLLHDVGHSAFSHAVESVLKRDPEIRPKVNGKGFLTHEAFTKHIVSEVLPGISVISRWVNDELGQDPYEFFSEISKIATGDVSIEKPYLSQLMSGDIDADRIDFLLRDSYHTGVSLGLIDLDQIIQCLCIRENNVVLGDPEAGSFGEEMTLAAAESMLIARSHHYTAIIHHPRTQSVRVMLLNALESTLSKLRGQMGDEAVAEMVAEFFTSYNDADLLDLISRNGDEAARNLLRDIRDGRIYTPVARFNQKTLSPGTRMALSTIAHHGVATKMLERGLEKELGDVLVDLSIATGVPKTAMVMAGGHENFFYDESALANGLVRAISRQMSLTAFTHPDAAIGSELASAHQKMRELVDDLSPRLLNFIRGDQYLPIEGLILLLYAIHKLFEVEKDGFISIPRIRNITWLYRNVALFREDSRLKYLFDYDFHTRYGFPYSNKVYEDIQLLVAMGIVDEDLRYFEKDGRFRQRYEYAFTDAGIQYAASIVDSYGREFGMITEHLTMNKHSIPRDIVTIPLARYQRDRKKRTSGANR
ncbi:HD domain-containing protein [Methanococcoides vulcani]|uniref:HD domain-containing protein n=1 Tax=Methanococcoides vulcani TaxID=1353158 RepID=A0A1H9ZAZ7_9EURY|nr:HD domain-containing protein [Methanococcoides vulcani]SES78718.1 HD domain-containing protein [Methanococcoides vulcani]